MLLLWTTSCWLVIGGLLRPVLPGGWLTVTAVAILCLTPILYITPGRTIGEIPLRIGTLPEVTVLTLRRSEGAEELT